MARSLVKRRGDRWWQRGRALVARYYRPVPEANVNGGIEVLRRLGMVLVAAAIALSGCGLTEPEPADVSVQSTERTLWPWEVSPPGPARPFPPNSVSAERTIPATLSPTPADFTGPISRWTPPTAIAPSSPGPTSASAGSPSPTRSSSTPTKTPTSSPSKTPTKTPTPTETPTPTPTETPCEDPDEGEEPCSDPSDPPCDEPGEGNEGEPCEEPCEAPGDEPGNDECEDPDPDPAEPCADPDEGEEPCSDPQD